MTTSQATQAANGMRRAEGSGRWSEGQLAALEVLESHLPEQERTGAVLEAVGISKKFGGLQALQEIDLTIEAARTTGLIGPNGAGKSTFFDCITGFTVPDSGTVHAFGHDVTKRPPWKRAKIGLARTFQANHIAPGLSVEENLLIGADLSLSGGLVKNALRIGRAYSQERAARQVAAAVAHLLDMDRYLGVRAGVLDFGAQRRIEIGRALLGPARLILLDEPTAGVDAVEAARLLALIKQLQVDLGLAVLIIEHHVRSVLGMCDTIYVLERGQMIFSGEPQQVRENERVRAAYLGDASAL